MGDLDCGGGSRKLKSCPLLVESSRYVLSACKYASEYASEYASGYASDVFILL